MGWTISFNCKDNFSFNSLVFVSFRQICSNSNSNYHSIYSINYNLEKQKNQNKLLPEHLDDIIGAFENRQNIEKFAHVASLQQVKDNDFNLNIPRYVDTFEAEAEIDLAAIAQQLQDLEADSQNTDQVIADFCKQLGIDSPFAEVK